MYRPRAITVLAEVPRRLTIEDLDVGSLTLGIPLMVVLLHISRIGPVTSVTSEEVCNFDTTDERCQPSWMFSCIQIDTVRIVKRNMERSLVPRGFPSFLFSM